MPRFHQVKTNFTAGEISPRLLGRVDLRAYDNGALALRNVFIHPTGGVTRRAGLRFVAQARGAGRLVAFEFSTESTHLLAFSVGKIDVFQDDAVVATLDAPWSAEQLAQISWTQSPDALLICHPEVQPRKLTRGDGVWALTPWAFLTRDDLVRQPHYRFAEDGVTVTPSATSGTITVTASAPVFDPLHDGTRMRIKGKQLLITGVASPTQVNATVKETLDDTTATTEWEEQAFSPRRGWPVSAAFHQDRLVIGGSRDLPNRLWMSKSADYWNFDLGEGLDDESIEFGILSDQVNAVRAVYSSRHLQVFTSGAEYMVTGDPLTPSSIQINHQTRVGSASDRAIPPRDVDGATLFVSRNGREIREFLYTDSEQAYQANDLALLAAHLVVDPVDQDYDKARRLLMVAMDDGTIAALTVYRNEQVNAWTGLDTDGAFASIAVVGDDLYVLVRRDDGWMVERFDDDASLDSAVIATDDAPRVSWSGFGHLEGREVTVLADSIPVGTATVHAGSITLDEAASTVQAGLPFAHVIEPTPPNLLNQGGDGRALRMIEVCFRLYDTAALRVDVGNGPIDLPLHRFGPQPPEGYAPARFTGDRRLRALGWRRDIDQPPWRIEQDSPVPFTLLSATMDLKVSD